MIDDITARFKPLVEWVAEKMPNNNAKLNTVNRLQEALWWCMLASSQDEHNVQKKEKKKK